MNRLDQAPVSQTNQLLADWEKIKEDFQFPSFLQLRSYDKKLSENEKETLFSKLKECVQLGETTNDLTDREQLQWLAREIGDYIYFLCVIYSSTTILPFIEIENFQTFHNIPYPRNLYFTGRDEELDKIYSFFVGSKSNAIRSLALVGMGGIGKTQLAIEYAYRYKDQYSAIYWFQADDRDLLLYSIVELAEQRIPEQSNHDDPKTVAENLKHYLEKQSGWLLIVDNADDFSIVKEFLPKLGDGCILITTRSSPLPLDPTIHQMEISIKQMEISPLLLNEGKLLLLRRAEQLKYTTDLNQIKPEEIGMAEELTKELGMLPLAIDQAGASSRADALKSAKCRVI